MAIRRKGLEIEIISVLDELTEIKKKRTNKNETLIKKKASKYIKKKNPCDIFYN